MTAPAPENDLRSSIRTIPDYPKPGIMFRDITTLLGDARAGQAGAALERVIADLAVIIDEAATAAHRLSIQARHRLRERGLGQHRSHHDSKDCAHVAIHEGIRPWSSMRARPRPIDPSCAGLTRASIYLLQDGMPDRARQRR